jgi:hypothetical protein
MNTVYPPSINKLNGGYSSSHKAYDHDDIPDNRAFCSLRNASVVIVVDKYSSSWNQGGAGDPTPGGLTTEDYGNFVKLSGQDYEGNWLYQISAHLVKGIPVRAGQKLQMGDVIGTIGNNQTDSGHSTGGHTHTEYRDLDGKNISVTFKTPENKPIEEATMSYSEEQMTVVRLERDKNWNLYQEQLVIIKKQKEESDRKIQELEEKLATQTSTENPPEGTVTLENVSFQIDELQLALSSLATKSDQKEAIKAIEDQTKAIENLSKKILGTPTVQVPTENIIQSIINWLKGTK